jgi:hypothetical protein
MADQSLRLPSINPRGKFQGEARPGSKEAKAKKFFWSVITDNSVHVTSYLQLPTTNLSQLSQVARPGAGKKSKAGRHSQAAAPAPTSRPATPDTPSTGWANIFPPVAVPGPENLSSEKSSDAFPDLPTNSMETDSARLNSPALVSFRTAISLPPIGKGKTK